MTLSRLTAGGLLASLLVTVVAVTAGCGGSTADSAKSSDQAKSKLTAMLPDAIRSSGKLRVATISDYPPAEYKDGSGTLTGYEVDLGKALGEALGVDVEFQVANFASILTGIQAGRYDVGITSMTDTAERERQADFVNYLNDGISLLVPKDNPKHATSSLASLCGLGIAAARGTIQVDLLKKFSGEKCGSRPIRLPLFDSPAEGILQVQTGRSDGYVADALVADYLAKQQADARKGNLSVVALPSIKLPPLGMPIAKSNGQLRDALVAAMKDIIASGRYEAILKKWKIDGMGLSEPAVNMAGKGA